MCACRQKKTSFFIEDILKDAKKNYKNINISSEPTEPLKCFAQEPASKANIEVKERRQDEERFDRVEVQKRKEKEQRFEVICEVEKELEYGKINLEHRRNTFPLYPTAVKPFPWYKKEYGRHFSYYSDPMFNTNHILRTQLAANRFLPPYARQPYGFDRVPLSWTSPWWGLGGRRKGGQVRFSATQTSALERRFAASKYLSPDERRALASSLRLSDRQVKTWFQNRRAKWRRLAPDCADPGSPDTSDDDLPTGG